MRTNQYLIDFYNNYDEDSRLEPKHGTVEFLTTMRYIEKYLKPGNCVLEIGAGTGRYSHALARQGYSVSAIELIELILSRLVDTFSSRILYPMLLLSGNHSIAAVLSWEEDLH